MSMVIPEQPKLASLMAWVNTVRHTMRVARYWQVQCPPKAPVIGDDIWLQLATLLPRLDPVNRSQVWSLFWGGQPELTGHWLALTDAIQHLGHADRVLAPQSLLIDNFSLPADAFLVQRPLSDEEDTDVLVRPVEDNEPRSAVNVPLTLLRLLCAELILPVPYLALNDVEIIDIPRLLRLRISQYNVYKAAFFAGVVSPAPATGCALNL